MSLIMCPIEHESNDTQYALQILDYMIRHENISAQHL